MARYENSKSQKIASIVEKAAASVFDSDYQQICDGLDIAKDECFKLELNDDDRREVIRRVSEWRLILCCEKNLQFDLVNQEYHNLQELGFTNLDIESRIVTQFANFCIENNENDIAMQILKDLIDKLEIAIVETKSDFYNEMLVLSKNKFSEAQTKKGVGSSLM